MAAKVPLGIFWDIENCSVPSAFVYNASGLAKMIRDFIADKHPKCGFAQEFISVCDVTKMDRRVVEGLDRNGVTTVHVAGTAKNAADDKLKELIDLFIDKCDDSSRGQTVKAVLCVITGDINFSAPIRKALRKNLNVILIHGKSHSRDLKNLVKDSYFFEDVICSGPTSIADTPAKPAYLLVSNLSANIHSGEVMRRLSILTNNCGGRPELRNGGAIVRFGCKDDAQRCLQRINGAYLGGNRIVAVLTTEDIPRMSRKNTKRHMSADNHSPGKLRKFLSNDNLSQSRETSLNRRTLAANGHTFNRESTDPRLTSLCKSWIEGMDTRRGENVLSRVRQLVSTWNDPNIKPEFVQNAYRDLKEQDKDGKVNLYVTAITPEANEVLVSGAKRYLNGKSGIHWFQVRPKDSAKPFAVGRYIPPPQRDDHIDQCRLILKGLHTTKEQNVLKTVRKIVRKWNDSKVKPKFVKEVIRDRIFPEKDGKVLLFITASSPEACKALVSSGQKHLENGLKWNFYDPKAPFGTVASDKSDTESEVQIISDTSSVTDNIKPNGKNMAIEDNKISVIFGLESKVGQNMTKVVRKMVNKWNDKSVHGNFVDKVERMADCLLDKDRKYQLQVVQQWAVWAINGESCEALVKSAHKYLDPKDGIIWTKPNSRLTALSAPKRPLTSLPPLNRSIPREVSKPEEINTTIDIDDDEPEIVAIVESYIPLCSTSSSVGTARPESTAEEALVETNNQSTPQKSPMQGIVRGIENLFTPSRSGHKPTKVARKEYALKCVDSPSIPYDYILETGLTDGMGFSITGRPKPLAREFVINFCSESNIALHFKVDLQNSSVVRNSLMYDVWGPEEAEGLGFPFAVNQTFTLKILVEGQQYVIAVNGQTYCTYEHRIPFFDVNKISLIGDLVIDSLSVY